MTRRRRSSVAATSTLLLLLLVFAPATDASPLGGATRRAAAIAAPTPHGLPEGFGRGSTSAIVSRRVAALVAREGKARAIVILDDGGLLETATATSELGAASASHVINSLVPAMRALKEAVFARLPGVAVVRRYSTLPIALVEIRSTAALRRAASDPAVVAISPDRRYRMQLAQSLPLIGQPIAAATGQIGTGTAVAVLDTGIDYTRAAFGTCPNVGAAGCKVVAAQDFATPDGLLDEGVLHGTNVGAIVLGVAPDTRLLALDVFNGSTSNDSIILSAINFVISNQATYNIRAMNLSLGDRSASASPCSSGGNPYVSAFGSARAVGIAPVIAAGNGAFDNGSFRIGLASPACTPGALSVGATYDANVGGLAWGSAPDVCSDPSTSADLITCFSQTASYLTLLAPGALISAAGITHGGTSQAAPHVAGAVALLAAANPAATITAIESALRTTGPLLHDPLINMDFHRLALPAALTAIGTTPPPPPPPGGCTISGDAADNTLDGTTGDDVMCAGGGDDLVLAGDGNDAIDGGDGFDVLSFQNLGVGVGVDLTAGTAVVGGFTITLQGIEAVAGTRFPDSIRGDAGDNELYGLGGNDVIDGAGGFDYARYDLAGRRLQVDLVLGSSRGEGLDTLNAIEGVVGGPKNDEILGNGAENWLYGLRGDDLLWGLAGPDTLFGGLGDDGLVGGGGLDDLLGGPGRDLCAQGSPTRTVPC